MKRPLLSLSLLISSFSLCIAQELTLTITNPGNTQRQEVAETDYQTICKKLDIDKGTPIIVHNALGQEQTYQITYDGLLLIDAAVQPHSTATYTITKGTPSSFRESTKGRVYPERADDLTWENDRGIYRMYGPALQRSGEKAFGTDIWVKNTPELVVEERYRQHMWGVGQRDSLYRIGKKKEANDIGLATSFHHDHGYGLDCYAVGPSLGCGAPALMLDGRLIFPYSWQECEIYDNGPLRFTAKLTYGMTADGTKECRLISLDKGSHFNLITVNYEGITTPMAFATGVVLHDNDNLVLGKDFVLYADPTENPKVHQSQIYVATLFPNGVDETVMLEGEKNHGIGIVHNYLGKPYTYYFGSAWSGYDVRTLAEWQLLVNEYLHNLANPLNIELH